MGGYRAAILAIIFLLAAGVAVACAAPSGPSIQAKDTWARPALISPQGSGMASTGAVFMRLVNSGSQADRLIGGQTDVAKIVEIHQTVIEDDLARMQMLPEGLEVPARDEVLLEPGSYHMMLFDLQRNLNVGDTFRIELWFAESDNLTVVVEVREP
jgi:periplasmic copper chaperone A